MTFAQIGILSGVAAIAIAAIFVVAVLILRRNDRASMQASVRRQMAEVERHRAVRTKGASR